MHRNSNKLLLMKCDLSDCKANIKIKLYLLGDYCLLHMSRRYNYNILILYFTLIHEFHCFLKS